MTSHQNQFTKTLVEGYQSAANRESSNNQQDTTPHEASVQLLPKLNSQRNKVQDLNKTVHGLVDAPRIFYRKQMEELKHTDSHQPKMDFKLFTYKLKDKTLKDAVTITQVEDSPTVGKQNITKLAQQEVEKKLRLSSIEDLPIRILSLNQNRHYNRGLGEDSKHYVDDPEIPYPSYLHDEVEQYILNQGLQLYRGNPKRIAFTDREKPFSNANQPSANTKDVKYQMNTLVLRLSTEQPKMVHEVRYAHPSFNIVDAFTKLAKASIISRQLTSAGPLAKTWPKSRRTEQRRGSQDERSKIDLEAPVTSSRAKPLESELPRAMSTSPKNRFYSTQIYRIWVTFMMKPSRESLEFHSMVP